LKVRGRGYRVVWTPFAELFHLECASRGLDDTPAKRELYRSELQYIRKTWGPLVESADPFHSPNLLFAWDGLQVPSAPRRRKPWQSRG
jgi:O-antigen biosynthesis protein